MAGYYETYESRSRRRHTGRSVLGYWIPLAVTVTAATVGLAAWIWSERDEDDYEDTDDDYDRERKERRSKEHGQYHENSERSEVVETRSAAYEAEASRDPSFSLRAEQRASQDISTGVVARMSGAIRRTPSPQQILDEASRRVAAGVAAAGAVVGGALSSIREESRDDYGDHSRWSEEADMRVAQGEAPEVQDTRDVASFTGQLSSNTGTVEARPGVGSSRPTAPSKFNLKRKTVAIVISAGASEDSHKIDPDDHHEDAVSSSESD